MNPGETGQINDTVWCIKDRFVNAYIFRGDQGYILVDAGISKKNFKAELGKIGITPEQITALLLTHTDGDHIGATGLLKSLKHLPPIKSFKYILTSHYGPVRTGI
jgi:glyoxylase-like metal-dependent hydrolase (beta-lactamase superfamily II)